MSMFNVNIHIKNKTFNQRVIFRFLPNLRRLNKITKSFVILLSLRRFGRNRNINDNHMALIIHSIKLGNHTKR